MTFVWMGCDLSICHNESGTADVECHRKVLSRWEVTGPINSLVNYRVCRLSVHWV